MHKEILTQEQLKLLPLIKSFNKDFGLVGGTALALHLGHRHSIDFDLFSLKSFDNLKIQKQIKKNYIIEKTLVDQVGEYTVLVKGIKITFLTYPFAICYNKKFNALIKLPDLLTLAAMKAYALGRRAKWKDYVDLYFVIRDQYSIGEIIKKAKKIFGHEFNEKNFRNSLSYFKDIDYSEAVDFLPGFEIKEKIIKKNLIEFSLKF